MSNRISVMVSKQFAAHKLFENDIASLGQRNSFDLTSPLERPGEVFRAGIDNQHFTIHVIGSRTEP